MKIVVECLDKKLSGEFNFVFSQLNIAPALHDTQNYSFSKRWLTVQKINVWYKI